LAQLRVFRGLNSEFDLADHYSLEYEEPRLFVETATLFTRREPRVFVDVIS